jgi:hypothetical protein
LSKQLVRYMGWFWGHFCQDILARLALAVDLLEQRGDEHDFDMIIESRSHANVLALVQAVLGSKSANRRVLFMPTACLRGNARQCAFYIRCRELLIVEMFPELVNSWLSDDDLEDAVPSGLRCAQRRVQAFFDARLDEIEQRRRQMEVSDRLVVSGSRSARYGESGECSIFKSQPITSLDALGQTGPGRSERACRSAHSWLTSHVKSPPTAPFRIVFLGRGMSPCPPDRERCARNAADVLEALDSVGLLLSHLYYPSTMLAARESARGCVYINQEMNTHTFLEMVDVLRHAHLIVGVQGSQNFNAIFASRGTAFIEMVPTHDKIRAESNRIYLESMGMKTAILPIYGIHMHDATPFAIEPCRLVRLIDLMQTNITSPLQRCNMMSELQWRSECHFVQRCFKAGGERASHADLSREAVEAGDASPGRFELQRQQEPEASNSLLQQSFCRGADLEQLAPRDAMPSVRFDPSCYSSDVETLEALMWKGVPSFINMDFELSPPIDNRTLTVVFHVNGLAYVVVHFRPSNTACGWSFESAEYQLGFNQSQLDLEQHQVGCLARLEVHLLPLGIVPDRGNVYMAEARVVCFRPAGMTLPLQEPVSRMFFRVATSGARAKVMMLVYLEECHQNITPAVSCVAAVRRLSPQLRQAARVILVSVCPPEVTKDAVEGYVDRLSQAVQCVSEECPGIAVRLYFPEYGASRSYSRTLEAVFHGFDGLVLVLHDSIDYGANYVNSARSTVKRVQKESGCDDILLTFKGGTLCSQLSVNSSYAWSGGEAWLSAGALATLAFFAASAQWDMMEYLCTMLHVSDVMRPFYISYIADMCGVPLILAETDADAAARSGGATWTDEGLRSLQPDASGLMKACADKLTDEAPGQRHQYDHTMISLKDFCSWVMER